MSVLMFGYTCHSVHVEIGGQYAGVSSYTIQVPEHQTWWQYLYLLYNLGGPQTNLTLLTYLIYCGVPENFNGSLQDGRILEAPLFLLRASNIKTVRGNECVGH